jgi:hypothetical protein
MARYTDRMENLEDVIREIEEARAKEIEKRTGKGRGKRSLTK